MATSESLRVTGQLESSFLNYPTADGTAGQAIITDGVGNLTFGNLPDNSNTATVLQNSEPDISTNIFISSGTRAILKIDVFGRLVATGDVITFSIIASYGSDGIGNIIRIGTKDDVLINHDSGVTRVAGSRMDARTLALGANIVGVELFGDTDSDVVYEVKWVALPSAL